MTVCQEVASYWDKAGALPFHSLVSDWENQRHTDMELLTVMSAKKRTQRQRVRLGSIFIEKQREDTKRALAKSLSMERSQASGRHPSKGKDTPES